MSFNFFHVRLPWQPKLSCNFHKIFIYVIRTLSLIFLWKISFLAQRVHVSEILRHFSKLYPTHSRLVYDPTGKILAILYSEVSNMLPAKYQPNRPSGSGVEVIWMIFTIYGHGGHLEFQIMTHFCLCNFHKNFIYVIRTLSLIFLWKISFLAQRVHVSEILCFFFQLYPTHSRSVYDPTGMILAIL